MCHQAGRGRRKCWRRAGGAGNVGTLPDSLPARRPAAMSADSAAPTPPAPRTGWASLRDLTGYQWFVFVVCCLAWDMDCLDQQLFTLARRPAMPDLVPKVTPEDPRFAAVREDMTAKAAAEGKPAPPDEAVEKAIQSADVGAAAG